MQPHGQRRRITESEKIIAKVFTTRWSIFVDKIITFLAGNSSWVKSHEGKCGCVQHLLLSARCSRSALRRHEGSVKNQFVLGVLTEGGRWWRHKRKWKLIGSLHVLKSSACIFVIVLHEERWICLNFPIQENKKRIGTTKKKKLQKRKEKKKDSKKKTNARKKTKESNEARKRIILLATPLSMKPWF